MTRKLSQNTVNKFKKRLLAEQEQLKSLLERHQEERERIRLSEASAERSPDPTSADGGSMAFELEKELTLDENTKHLLNQIEHALVLIKKKSMESAKAVRSLYQWQDLKPFHTLATVKTVQLLSILKSNKIPFIISITLGIVDNILKAFIRFNDYNNLVLIDNILEIDLNYNTGIAFGILKDRAEFTFVLSFIVLIWLIFQFKNKFTNKIEEYAFIFVLGGAFGNLGERFINLLNGNDGKVTDFIELLFIPSFNLADSFITIGISLLIISELKNFKN